MTLASALELGITIAEAALRGVTIATEGRDLIDKLIAEQRDPNDAEWARLTAITDQLHAAIQRHSSEVPG